MIPARWPPAYSSHGSGAPEVSTVSAERPGTASEAGQTSTSTGWAATMRSSTSAFAPSAAAAVAVARSGERLVIPLLEELQLLPLAVDRRVEPLGMLDRPDLRAYEEVVRVERERRPPRRERVG